MKIALAHHVRAREGHRLQIELADIKMVLMPRLGLLRMLDPDGEHDFNAPQMRLLIKPYAEEFKRVVLQDKIQHGMDVKGALEVYRHFKLLRAAPTWGPVPLSCTCKTCFGHGVCADSLLFVSLFDPSIEVPSGYVGATVSDRKKCKSVGGLAGRGCVASRRRRTTRRRSIPRQRS